MKNKKIVSVIMALMLVIAQFCVSGFNVKAANPITVNVRIEGLSNTIINSNVSGTDSDNALLLVKNLLTSKGIHFTTATSYGSEIITEINGLAQGKFGGYDGWMFYVKSGEKVINPQVGMGDYKPLNGDTIVMYYSDFTVPFVNALKFDPNVVKENNPFSMQLISQDGLPIANANVKIDNSSYISDSYGKINISGLAKGTHSYDISGYNGDNKISTVIRDSGTFNIDNVTSLNINYDNSKDNTLGNGDNTKIVKSVDNEINVLSDYFNNHGNDAWSAVSLNKLGIKPNTGFIKDFSNDVVKNGVKDTSNTDIEKMIMGITAAGYTPYDFQGNNLVSELLNRDINSFQINDAIFALFAYDYANIPENYKITKQKLIDLIVSKEFTYKNNDNWKDYTGWSIVYDKTSPFIDPDMTGAAISALSPYYKTNSTVKKAIDNAVYTLPLLENQSGYMPGKYGIASESNSFVIMGLCAVGINPEGTNFIKIKGDLVSALFSFKTGTGTYKHALDGNEDYLATDEAFRSIIALKEFKDNGSGYYYKSNIDASKLTKYVETSSNSNSKTTDSVSTTSKGTLPKTGMLLDTKVLTVIGSMFILAGIVILAFKKKEESLH